MKFAISLGACWLAATALAATEPAAIPIPQNRMRAFEAEAAGLIGGASKVADGAASGGYLVSLTKPGQGVKFAGLPAAEQIGDSLCVGGEWARSASRSTTSRRAR